MPALISRQPAPAVVTAKSDKSKATTDRHNDTADARATSQGSGAAIDATNEKDEVADRVPAPTTSRSTTVRMPRRLDVICKRCHARIPIFVMRKHARNIDRIEEQQEAMEEEHKRVCAKQARSHSNKRRPSPTASRSSPSQKKKTGGAPPATVTATQATAGVAKFTTPSTRSDESKGTGRVKGTPAASRASLSEREREAALKARFAASEARRLEDLARRAKKAAELERLKKEFPLNGDRPAGKRGRDMTDADERCIAFRDDLFKPKAGEPDAKRLRKE
ncbi:hypothetical protein K525DRAFT_184510 [Schizophyllum commune Loenen D]|nr:hypothetical protein K525DRAFT_184510 [Schizophyllum commune Loenen D]